LNDLMLIPYDRLDIVSIYREPCVFTDCYEHTGNWRTIDLKLCPAPLRPAHLIPNEQGLALARVRRLVSPSCPLP
jgi:hypothetical protein